MAAASNETFFSKKILFFLKKKVDKIPKIAIIGSIISSLKFSGGLKVLPQRATPLDEEIR